MEAELQCLQWKGDAQTGILALVDQRILPDREVWIECKNVDDVADAIKTMVVRGAPAIGIAAAFGLVLARQRSDNVVKAIQQLAATRPTAVNLFWALEKCKEALGHGASVENLLDVAKNIHQEDIANNEKMGEFGAKHIENGMGILTHCNTGALATGGIGTALGVIYTAHKQGKKIHVYVDETRPRLQGARLTTWECHKLGIPYTLICDNMAASLMAKGKIQMAIAGADRIAANGDVANKIGTYSVAVNCAFHKIPMYTAAPKSTFDLSIPDGSHIPIEERDTKEVTQWGEEETCASNSPVYNPGFDVTPAKLTKAIFTEKGEISPVTTENVKKVLES